LKEVRVAYILNLTDRNMTREMISMRVNVRVCKNNLRRPGPVAAKLVPCTVWYKWPSRHHCQSGHTATHSANYSIITQ